MEGRPLPPLPSHSGRMSPSMHSPPTLPHPPLYSQWSQGMKRKSLQPSPLCLEQRSKVYPSSKLPQAQHSPIIPGDHSGRKTKVKRPSLPHSIAIQIPQSDAKMEPIGSLPVSCVAESLQYPYSYVTRGELNVMVKVGKAPCHSASNSPILQKKTKQEETSKTTTLTRSKSLPFIVDP